MLFDGWDSWFVYAGAEAKSSMVQMIKDINAQVIEGIFFIHLFFFLLVASVIFCLLLWRLTNLFYP